MAQDTTKSKIQNDSRKVVQRVSISIKPNILEKLDNLADLLGINRSALVALAITDYCLRNSNRNDI